MLAVPNPFLLVLDDVHELTGPEAVLRLGRLLDHIPTGSVVALAGRSLSELHLARREVAGTVCHLGAADLAFDTAETTTALGPAAAGLDAAGLDRLVATVDGWPAGVALASAILGQEPNAMAALTGLPASRLVRAYVDQELLAVEDPANRTFVLHTAVLGRMTGPLCDAVLESTGSAERLEAMTAAGDRFLSALEGEAAWYRFHPLIGEALVAELRRRDPAVEATLHRRAAG